MGNKNLKDYAVKFSKDRQPSQSARAKAGKKASATCKKRRELSQLLSLALKGQFGAEINKTLSFQLGLKANTLEEALHFVQIAKAIGKEDTASYQALMQTSGLNKPLKIEQTGDAKPTVIKTADGTVIEF